MEGSKYYKRSLTEVLKEATKYFKVVLLTGPRQVGKSTLLKHALKNERNYVTLDDSEALALAKEDPVEFFRAYPAPLLIDEVQRAPGLFIHIKRIVDESDKKGQFWLTGSQQFHLMREASDSLAGRVAVLSMQGFSQAEKHRDPERAPFLPNLSLRTKRSAPTQHEAYTDIVHGSYPQLWDGTPGSLFYPSYISTYLERDVREIVNITNTGAFLRLLRVAAARTGQLINYDDMSRDIGVSPPTVKNWLSVLETSGLIYLLQPWSTNLTQRAVKTPKLYFMDTGLCCHLCGLSTAEMAMNAPNSGALFETYVISEIIKSHWHHGQNTAFYFYRDVNQREIDLLIETEGKVWPIEIKRTSTPKAEMVRHFSIIDENVRGKGALICTAEKLLPLSKNAITVPVLYI